MKRPREQVCPFLDTINRSVLDFDFEKICSVTLSPHNVYGCLVCGKFFQGKSPGSPAHDHALQLDHRVFINLDSGSIRCLPEDYLVSDPSLADIQFNLHPKYERLDVLDKKENFQTICLEGTSYVPGIMGLNNLKDTDWLNVVLQCLLRVKSIRNFFLKEENYSSCKSVLVQRFGEIVRKLCNPKAYKPHVSPHELLQVITTASEKKFKIGQQCDVAQFISWLIHSLDRDLSQSLKSKSPFGKAFQGIVKITTIKNEIAMTDDLVEEKLVPFKYLSLKLPSDPLFKEEEQISSIPQIPIDSLLSKFDGEKLEILDVQIPEHPSRRKLNSLSVSELKSLALEHNIDISSVVEKSHLIDSLVSWFDTHPPSSNINTHYRLIGNIVHEGMLGGNLEQDANALFKQGRGHYKCHVLHQPSSTWFQVQDLVVKEIMPQMVAVSEAYVQIWERKRQDV